jgi:hypothetical protein
MNAGNHDWDRWHRRRRTLAAVTLASVAWGSWEMAGCTTTDCIAVNTDRVTTSLVGPTDNPPAQPIIIDATVIASGGGGGDVFVYPSAATAVATAGAVTVSHS